MRRERKLSAEDRILWGKVARSAKPLPGRLEDLLQFETVFEEPAEPSKSAPDAVTAIPSQAHQPNLKPAISDRKIHPMEKPVKRRIAKGRLSLEARLDLHGLVQSDAHSVLLDFLLRAHDRGLRHVLVITGKGSSFGSEGVLKRAVPLWFSKPEFRSLISSYEPAARQHGGDGALYIRLSRRPGGG